MHLGGFLAAADAAAQLVQLRQSEAVGVFNDHDRGVGHVHTHLDNRRGHEHLRLVVAEALHDGLLLGSGHAPVQKLDPIIGEHGSLQVGRLFRGGRHVVALQVVVGLDADGGVLVGLLVRLAPPSAASAVRRLRVALAAILADEGAHHVHLLAARERRAGGVVGMAAVGLLMHERGALRRVVRSVLEVGQGQVAEQRQRQRARDGRGREVQRVGRIALRQQLGALLHAEALLLVDDHEAEPPGRHIVLEQRVRADEHVHRALRHAREDGLAFGRGRGAGQHRPGDAGGIEQRPQTLAVLAREHLGGSHEQSLRTRVRGRREREGGDDGLAGAHVAQQQVVRRLRRSEGGEDVALGLLLLVGKPEGHRLGERRHARPVHRVDDLFAPVRALVRLAHEHQLEQQQLLVHEAAARLGHFVHRMREVDARQRRAAAHQAVLRTQLERQRIMQPAYGLQRVSHEPSHPRSGYLLASGVHGDEHARAVHERQLNEREARLGLLELDLVHRAFDGALLADDPSGHGCLAREVDVAPREVRGQVAHRADAEPVERASARRAHQTNAPDRFVERERCCKSVGPVVIQRT